MTAVDIFETLVDILRDVDFPLIVKRSRFYVDVYVFHTAKCSLRYKNVH